MNVTSKMNDAPLYYLPICQGEAILSWVTRELSTAWILFFHQCSHKPSSEERITTSSKQTPQHRCSFRKMMRPFSWSMQVFLSSVLLLMFVICPNFSPLRSMNDKPLALPLLLRVCLCASFRAIFSGLWEWMYLPLLGFVHRTAQCWWHWVAFVSWYICFTLWTVSSTRAESCVSCRDRVKTMQLISGFSFWHKASQNTFNFLRNGTDAGKFG